MLTFNLSNVNFLILAEGCWSRVCVVSLVSGVCVSSGCCFLIYCSPGLLCNICTLEIHPGGQRRLQWCGFSPQASCLKALICSHWFWSGNDFHWYYWVGKHVLLQLLSLHTNWRARTALSVSFFCVPSISPQYVTESFYCMKPCPDVFLFISTLSCISCWQWWAHYLPSLKSLFFPPTKPH